MQYLAQAGFPYEALVPIPSEDQVSVVGIANATYTPEFKIKVKWSGEKERKTNETEFMVVNFAEFDVLLSSRRFLEEAKKRVTLAWPLFNRPKDKGGRHDTSAWCFEPGMKNADDDEPQKPPSKKNSPEKSSAGRKQKPRGALNSRPN